MSVELEPCVTGITAVALGEFTPLPNKFGWWIVTVGVRAPKGIYNKKDLEGSENFIDFPQAMKRLSVLVLLMRLPPVSAE